ncbi:hypothetical protein CGRA01v4_06295 [Colletotrichum graminicola]|uniref:Uncharacterized protein n=1 Tax=Colletotrichum graminicola (strain M1.001 / M2 / FGSC 10212) TaxID=645133 RepID=E3Q2L8_COLGM|nr:uncharacterized protein GLRG_00463 [Colletotrichum graminicola M1.001]EFQ25319.1 hypothetical protein GLRG_00463 [Colletotrichum graminicola M1.001]WDK15013.1 hypothetical protein CGRA01v4_06295 [Colletotrichum graminicola]
MDPAAQQDSTQCPSQPAFPGILTFVAAIVAAAYVRITYLRNSDDEYPLARASLSWSKTESAWLSGLVISCPRVGAMAWLPVRPKELELVRRREALTARVQFTQMSMIPS